MTGRLARRNAMRNPRRTAGSASALMVGTAVVALFTTFGASIKASIDDIVDQDFGGDLVIVADDFSGAGLSPELAAGVAELPEVDRRRSAIGERHRHRRRQTTIDPPVVDPAASPRVLDLDVVEGIARRRSPPARSRSASDYAEDHGLALGSTRAGRRSPTARRPSSTVGAVYSDDQIVGDMIMTAGRLDAARRAARRRRRARSTSPTASS